MSVQTLERAVPFVRTLSSATNDTATPAQLRQGDLMLVSESGIPSGLVEMTKPDAGFALMPAKAGLGIGSHFIGKDAMVVGYGTGNGHPVDYLVTKSFVSLSHHEHATLLVPPGTWHVLRQREHVASSADVVPFVRAVDD